MDNAKIDRVMFRHPVAGGDLVLALMADRTIRILHKGVVCDPHEWPADQPERAVSRLGDPVHAVQSVLLGPGELPHGPVQPDPREVGGCRRARDHR